MKLVVKILIFASMIESLYAVPIARDISAEYKNGQVFLQWKESPENGSNLKVYVSKKPILKDSLDQAKLITDNLGCHSANDWYADPELCPKAKGPAHGWRINEHGSFLNKNDGLFVYTVEGENTHNLYFAVLGENEVHDDLAAGVNSLDRPVRAKAGEIQPIWQPDAKEPRAQGTGKPLALYLGSHTSRPAAPLTHLFFGTGQMGWREGLAFKFKVSVLKEVVLVEPYDRVWINRHLGSDETYERYNTLYKNIETFWYGTNDKIYDRSLRKNGTPTNYTERILIWMLDWVQENYKTDPQRVYAFGASMGTGVLRLATQNPDMFASVDLLVPFFDFGYRCGDESNAKRFESCCGDMDLVCSDGMVLGERLDLVNFVANYKGDLPFIVARVGRNDRSVYWARKPAFIKAMQENRHALLLGWDEGTHATAMRHKIPSFPNFREYRWFISRFARNKSWPAFTNFLLDDEPGNGEINNGDPNGFINYGLNWEDINENNNSYEATIQLNRPAAKYPVTVDVTPRNLQRFLPANNSRLQAKNTDRQGNIIEHKSITVDNNGIFTYEKFTITSDYGNRLIISNN